MPISYHPKRGTILICDFHGFVVPEMVKRRLVITLSSDMKDRPGLCTVVALSTTEPSVIKPYHFKFVLDPVLPPPYDSPYQWVKGDMIYSVSFERLAFPSIGKNTAGKRIYDIRVIDQDTMNNIECCVLNGLGIKY